MLTSLHTALQASLGSHFILGKSRLETLAILITALANGRTVNLSHIASQFSGSALHASNYRRLQRFFQHVHLDCDRVAYLIVRLLNLRQPYCLALDRTNWKVGSQHINMLVLAIVTNRFRIPFMWTMLDKGGTSNTTQRIALMQRYLSLFKASSIKVLLADREFIGTQWITFLCEKDIPFAIRLKQDMMVQLLDEDEHKRLYSFKSLMRKRKPTRPQVQWQGWLNGMASCHCLHFVARRLATGELLIIATNYHTPKAALNLYRKRWAIECLFGDTKTRGFNMEAGESRLKFDRLCVLDSKSFIK